MPTLINILAPERSGSTMMDLMLGSGPDVYSLGEIAAWFRLYRYRRDAHPPDVWKTLPGVTDANLDRLFRAPESAFHAGAFDLLGASHLIDSSKEKCWIIETQGWGETHGYDVFNLVIWKDPVEYAHSFWKRGRYDEWARVYKRFYSWVLNSELEFSSVALDDLIAHPSGTLEQLCSHVGMPYFAGKHRFWEFDHVNMDGSPGVKAQVQSHNSSIEKRPLSPEFLPLVDEVKAVIASEGIDAMIAKIAAQSVSRPLGLDTASSVGRSHGHRYQPTFPVRLRNWVHVRAKRSWLRFRHNTVLADWL